MGLHLTLTSEWEVYRWRPVAANNVVPKLIDDDGFFWRSQTQVYRNVRSDIKQVVTELQAQIDLARQQGLEPTHLDTHMGTLYYNEEYCKESCNLALQNDIPFMAFDYKAPLF